jgi:hypothetical protein
MLEDSQKKAKRAGMPISDIELVMMALAAVLAAQHFPREVDNWEGLPSSSRTWAAWKMAFCLAHLKHQCQILASGGGEPLGWVHGVLPEAAPTIEQLKIALNNLALAATNDSHPPAAHGGQPGPHNHSHNTHSDQQKLVDAAARAKGGGDTSGDSEESGKRGAGHLDPTKPPAPNQAPLTPAIAHLPSALPSNAFYIHIYPISKLYTDDMGQFLVKACSGNQYVMIAYHTNGNLILQQAFKSKSNTHRIAAYNAIMTGLAARGLSGSPNLGQ